MCGNILLLDLESIVLSSCVNKKKKTPLIKSLEEAGGPEIEASLIAYEKENGPLQIGEVFTSKGGKMENVDFVFRFMIDETELGGRDDTEEYLLQMVNNIMDVSFFFGVFIAPFLETN